MKMLATLFTALCVCWVPLLKAADNALEKEMEDYARYFYREHPEAAGEKKSRQARIDLVKNMKARHVLELTKDEEKLIRKRQNLISAEQYKTAMDELKALGSKNPEIIYLLKYSQKEDLKPVEKLLAYRLRQFYYVEAARKAVEDRSKPMLEIMNKYKEYQLAHGKPPASLADLNLPDNCKQFTNPIDGQKSDWIYIGHLGRKITAGTSHVVLIEPESKSKVRMCGLDDGEVKPFNSDSITQNLEKISKAPPASKGGAISAPNNPAIVHLKSLMAKYTAYRKQQKKDPESLADLELSDMEKQYKDPDTGNLLDWIFLGNKSKIKMKDGTTVVIVAPKGYKGVRISGLQDGRTVSISDKALSKILLK